MPKFNEPEFCREKITRTLLDDQRVGIAVLINPDGADDHCLSIFICDPLGKALSQRVILRATEIAVLHDPDSDDQVARIKQYEQRILKVAELSKKYGIPMENVAPPGTRGVIRTK